MRAQRTRSAAWKIALLLIASLEAARADAVDPAAAAATGKESEEVLEQDPNDRDDSNEDSNEVWEVNGIRLERDQVERLAADMAERTVDAVTRRIEGIALRDDQVGSLRRIYQEVALEVFERVVQVVEQPDLERGAKDARVRQLVIEGQRASHEQIVGVLDTDQMKLYSAWEERQLAAYESRRTSRRMRRRGRSR